MLTVTWRRCCRTRQQAAKNRRCPEASANRSPSVLIPITYSFFARLRKRNQTNVLYLTPAKVYSDLAMTPHAIRGGAPLVVSLLTAWITIAVPPLLNTE